MRLPDRLGQILRAAQHGDQLFGAVDDRERIGVQKADRPQSVAWFGEQAPDEMVADPPGADDERRRHEGGYPHGR